MSFIVNKLKDCLGCGVENVQSEFLLKGVRPLQKSKVGVGLQRAVSSHSKESVSSSKSLSRKRRDRKRSTHKVHLAVAKEEKRKMSLLLQETKLERHNKTAVDMDLSHYEEIHVETEQPPRKTLHHHHRKSRRDAKREGTGGHKSRQADDKVALLKSKPMSSADEDLLLPGDMWLLSRQMELMGASDKPSDAHFEAAVRKQLTSYKMQLESPKQQYDYYSSHSNAEQSQMENRTKSKKSDSMSVPSPTTPDDSQRGSHASSQHELQYIMKPKVVLPRTLNSDCGVRRKDPVWDKSENDSESHHERRQRHGLTRPRSRSVSEVIRPKEAHKETGTLRKDKAKRDVQVQTISHLAHVSTQSDSSLEKTSKPGDQPKDILAPTIKLSIKAFESYLNQSEGTLMRSRSVNKQDQIDMYTETLKRFFGKEGLVVESIESSSWESLAISTQGKAGVKKVSLKALDEPRSSRTSIASSTPPKPTIKFTTDRGTNCVIPQPCTSCLHKPPVIQVVRKNAHIQTKPMTPVKPVLKDQSVATDMITVSAGINVKPEVHNKYSQTTLVVEENENSDNLLIDIGIECTIDDFWCAKCESNLEKIGKSNMESKHVQTKVTLVKETGAVVDIPKLAVQPSSIKQSAEKESEVGYGDSPPSKGMKLSLVNIENKKGGDATNYKAESTPKWILDRSTDTLTPANTKPLGMTKYVSESLAEPKFTRKLSKTVVTQTDIRELSPSRNISTNTLKMKMVDRRVGESLPLPKYQCTDCGTSPSQVKDEKEKRSTSLDRESKIPRPSSSDPARKLQRQTTYTKLDVQPVAESNVSADILWTPPSDVSPNQGSELWPSVSPAVYDVEESKPDVLEEKRASRDDGSRPRRSGASSTTSTSNSSFSWSGKQSYDGPSEPQQSPPTTAVSSKTSLSALSTDSSEKSFYLPSSSEIRKDEINTIYKASKLPSESEESSMYPHSSEASKFEVTADIELIRTHGPIKPTVQPHAGHRQEVYKNPNESASTGVSRLSKFLERPQVETSMPLPYPFGSPFLDSEMTDQGSNNDPDSSDVSPAESLMALPHPFNSPSLYNIVQEAKAKRSSQPIEEQAGSAEGKSGCTKAEKQSDESVIQQSRGVRYGTQPTELKNQPRVSQSTKNVGKQPNAKENPSSGKKVSGGSRSVDTGIGRPKPPILAPSDQKEAYELIKKGHTSPEHGDDWRTHDSQLTSPIPSMQGTSTSSDGFTLQSKEEILNLSASERPKKVDPSTKMKAALKVVNDMIEKSPTMSELGNTAKAANAIIQREWFQISSTPSADPHIVEDYLDHFEEMSSTLLTYVVNMADKAGNTAMHYALSQGNFDVVSILLDSKVCNINLPNAAGYTAVMLVSLAQIRSDTHRCVLQRFLADADVNVRAQQHGQTALMLAVSHNRLDMVQLLIEGGADLNIQDEDGSTALMCAAEHGHAAIVQFLINQPDTDLNIKDVDGLTALDIALDAGHKDVGILLYAHKHFSRNNSPYSSLRGRRSKSATPTTRTASTPPPRTPGSPLPVRPPRHAHD